jgi:hypothetical protein
MADVTSLVPATAVVGQNLEITGVGFGSDVGASTVTVNGLAAVPTIWNDTRIVVAVPSGATSGPVIVTVGGVATDGVQVTVLAG